MARTSKLWKSSKLYRMHLKCKGIVGGIFALGLILGSGLTIAQPGVAHAQDVTGAVVDPYKAHIKISSIGASSSGRAVTLPLGKSVIISMPRDVRDVLVSSPATVDAIIRSPRTIYLTGTEIGTANVFFFDRKGRQILLVDAKVTRDVSELESLLKSTLPDSQFYVNPMGDKIVLSGIASNPVENRIAMDLATSFIGSDDDVISAQTVSSGQQVLLRVKVAEIARTTIKQLGLGASLSAATLGTYNITAAIPRVFTANGSFLGGPSASISKGGFTGNLEMLERSGIFRTLAEPNLTTVSGQTAEFQAGGEFPYPVQGPNLTTSVEFKSYGISVKFTPVVLSRGRISMKIGTEVSDLTFDNSVQVGATQGNTSGNTIPSLRVRKANTVVEVASGSSLMMAGLLQDRLRQSLNGFPGLKDIPVLGALFRSRDYIDESTELVVLVTPLIVESADNDRLAAPTDNFTPASEANAFFWGNMFEAYKPPHEPVGQYAGEVGFVIE